MTEEPCVVSGAFSERLVVSFHITMAVNSSRQYSLKIVEGFREIMNDHSELTSHISFDAFGESRTLISLRPLELQPSRKGRNILLHLRDFLARSVVRIETGQKFLIACQNS